MGNCGNKNKKIKREKPEMKRKKKKQREKKNFSLVEFLNAGDVNLRRSARTALKVDNGA